MTKETEKKVTKKKVTAKKTTVKKETTKKPVVEEAVVEKTTVKKETAKTHAAKKGAVEKVVKKKTIKLSDNTKTQGAAIEFVNIGKKYEGEEKYTLEDINLKIEPGNFTVILGASGSGKTTLLRMLAGLNSVTKGDLLIDGKRVNDLLPNERNIAMVFQSYALYPHMNVYKNISFGLRLAKERKDIIDRRVKDAATILNISDQLYKKPKELSGGQMQRVAIGRAIVRKPKIFLMDEPLSNLDAKLRESMRREIVSLHRMLGTTSVYVTHDQLEAMTMGTQIIVIDKGNIQQVGTGVDLYNTPANEFVAGFIGSPSMNLVKGKVKAGVFTSNDKLIKYKLSASQAKRIGDLTDITLGFRPEAVRPAKGKIAPSFKAMIDLVEIVGKEQHLILKASSDIDFVALAPSREKYVASSDKHEFGFIAEELHFFDSNTTVRIK